MRLSFAFLFSILFSHFLSAQVSITQEPPWIIREAYNPDATAPGGGVDGGVHMLLYTEQLNLDSEELYTQGVSKVVEYSGIQNSSTISADYDPSYQQLRFHRIDVIRNGAIINKLSYRDIQTARRETNAENFIYDGTISAFLNIPDVRMGDIILYSFSVKGFNPIHREKYSTSFVLNSTQAIDRLSVHVFGRSTVNYQVLNSDLQVKYRLENGVHHYEWSQQNIPPILPEEQSPSWHLQNALVTISEYDSWSEVIDWGTKIFSFPEPPTDELQGVIEAIKKAHPREGGRIRAALSFVQSEIRYLGLHSGIGGYKPNPPNKIVSQRFGDCKDKSVLLTTMLRTMGIEACPTLVNTSLRQVLPSLSPSPRIFDHCIVKVIDQKGTTLWYDPTLSDQGGRYDQVYVPDYRNGLVLDESMTGMDTIPNFGNNMIEVFNTFTLDELGKGGELEVRSHYFEGEADFMRAVFRNNNKDLIAREFLKFYAENYGAVSAVKPPVFVDDSLNNEFAVIERYRIDSIWRPSVENPDFLNLSVYPTNITNGLTMPTQLERNSPFALAFPMVRKQIVEVVLPQNYPLRPESKTIISDFFYYTFKSTYDRDSRVLTLNYYFKNQDDHVPAARIGDYYKDMVKLDQQLGYLISINKSMDASAGLIGFGMGYLFGIGLIGIFLIALVVVTIIIVRRLRKMG